MRRILVSIPDGAWKIIEEKLEGKIGEIVLAYLPEKGLLEKER